MPRHKQLVCQHLERVSRAFLKGRQALIREHVRGRHGVYALYRGERLYYVGLATDLRLRLGHHLNDRHSGSWDRFSIYLTIGEGHMRELEALVLRIVRPQGNRQAGKLARSHDLSGVLHAELKAHHSLEWKRLMGAPTRTGRAESAVERRSPGKGEKGRQPVLSAFIKGPMLLRARFKGKVVRARVRRDGSIRFATEIYRSPSRAAAVACKRKACNGWSFWKYERAPGEWVSLGNLRP